MILSQSAHNKFIEDVLKRYPEEACGVVAGDNYHACKNTHSEPTLMFRIDGRDRFDMERKHGPIQAILHSHPYKLAGSKEFVKNEFNPAWPSEHDQAGFIADNVPWGIVASDGEGTSEMTWLDEGEIKPFEGRRFAWFTSDCYTCVRDWHRLNTGIVMPNYTRKWNFWLERINTIEDNLAMLPNATKYATEKAEIGDIAVLELGGHQVVNHLGVISGNNEFLHQFAGENNYAQVARWDLWQHKTKYVFRMNK
jgi:proteasome lid subunit RPN8/RPN11